MPDGLDVEKLPGRKRGESPALWFRDEIVWNTEKTRFALAYTIHEASMMNEIGYICWGHTLSGKTEISGNFERIRATCWQRPWCIWVNDDIFTFKAYYYRKKSIFKGPSKLHLPVIGIYFDKGFAIVDGSDTAESRASSDLSLFKKFLPISEKKLIKKL